MRTRVIRLTLLVLLPAATAVAGYFLWDIERRADGVLAAGEDVDARLDRLNDTLMGIGAAQQSYVAPGQPDGPWLERTSALVAALFDEAAALRPHLRSPEGSAALQMLADTTAALIAADTRVRENLRLGQELMAADVIFTDGRSTLDVMIARLHEVRLAEHAAYGTERAALSQERWVVLGVTTLLWVMGVILVVTAAAPTTAAPVETVSGIGPAQQESVKSERASPPSVNLAAAAELCTALSRVTTTAELPGLLGRAATVLDASGIILWMSAGEELFAVTAHGYAPGAIARLGPIARDADNATAAAWRTGRTTTVAGNGTERGAMVAPMFEPDACMGVLAIEVRNGREQDPAAQAVAEMIAAQLATAVSAWPAASPAQTPVEATADAAAEPARHVAGI